MEQWEAALCRYMHLPVQILWWSSVEWYMLLLSYFAGSTLHPFLFLGIIFLPIYLFPSIRKKPRGFVLHAQIAFGVRRLYGYPSPLAGVMHE